MKISPIICSNCGDSIPLIAQLGIIRPWNSFELIGILIDEFPKPECFRCKAIIELPSWITFYSKISSTLTIYHDNTYSDEIVKSLLKGLKARFPEGMIFKFGDKKDIKEAISTHVLAFKSFLKELSQSQIEGKEEKFIAKRWQELTPEAFAAGIVAFTGIVKGIGGYVANSETDEAFDLKETLKLLKKKFADVQFQVWLQIIGRQWTKDYSLEDALSQHVKELGVYENNFETLSKFVEHIIKMLNEKKISIWAYHNALALHASLAMEMKQENQYEYLWAESYINNELANKKQEKFNNLSIFSVSKKRASSTISEKVIWNVMGKIIINKINQSDKNSENKGLGDRVKFFESLQEIAGELGYEKLVSRLMSSAELKFHHDDSEDIVSVIKKTFNDIANNPNFSNISEAVHQALYTIKQIVLQSRDSSVLKDIFEQALAMVAGDRVAEVDIEAWFGECAKLLNCPTVFIDKVQSTPRSWEYALPIKKRLNLWNERANAFRLMGKPDQALAITDSLINEIGNEKDLEWNLYVLQRNRGILLRESGFLDKSLSQFRELLGKENIEERAELLESTAATLMSLGKFKEAADTIREAIPLAGGRDGGNYVNRLSAMLANLIIYDGEHEEALNIVRKLPEGKDPISILAIANTYISLHLVDAKLEETDCQRLVKLISKITDISIKLEEQENWLLVPKVYNLLGSIQYMFDPIKSRDIWFKILQLSNKTNHALDSVALGRLATIAYKTGERDKAKSLLKLLPKALINQLENISDLSIGYNATYHICSVLNGLLSAALSFKAPWSEVRLIAELQRDAIGKAKITQFRTEETLNNDKFNVAITDELIASISPKNGKIAVLEFTNTRDLIIGLITVVDADGTVTTDRIDAYCKNIFEVRKRIMHLLSVWHTHRAGDPFEDSIWVEFEQWLQKEIGKRVPKGAHVIIIDHQDFVGIPWHVGLSPAWRCSYAPNWATLLQEREPQIDKKAHVGIFSTLRYKDSPDLQEALVSAIDSTRDWVKAHGYNYSEKREENADLNAFTSLMHDCDVTMLICHGFSTSDDHEVALLIAHNGVLPPMYCGNSIPNLDNYALSWRNIQALPRSSPLVLSAACSTAIQWQAGAGEQMGLFGALRHSGTKTFIGPRWDIDAKSVIPLLSKFLKECLADEVSAVDVLYNINCAAQEHLPRWLAWSLAIEGEWR